MVLITRNAAAQLPECLASVAFADEVVVVDSGSADGTPEIAARYGSRVVTKEWLGFGRQKQFAVEQAANDWVLCLDADERVSPELAASIVRALDTPSAPVYRMARCNRFLGRWLRHGEGFLHHPVDARAGHAARELVHRRAVVHDVAERGGLDEEDARHVGKRPEGVG